MALDYFLETTAEQELTEIAEHVSLLPQITERYDANHFATISGGRVGVFSCIDQWNIIKDAFGFSPTKQLGIRLNKENIALGLAEVVEISLDVLSFTGADLVLMFEGEKPVLLHVAGQLTLNSNSGVWKTDELLSLVKVPYKMQEIPSL